MNKQTKNQPNKKTHTTQKKQYFFYILHYFMETASA